MRSLQTDCRSVGKLQDLSHQSPISRISFRILSRHCATRINAACSGTARELAAGSYTPYSLASETRPEHLRRHGSVYNLKLDYNSTSRLSLQFVVDNVFGKEAPFPLPAYPTSSTLAIPNGIETYFSGILGRYFSLSARYNF